MCLKGLKGTLQRINGELRLTLNKETTVEHIEEIINLFNEEVHVINNPSHGLTMKFSSDIDITLQTMALDLQEEGATIKITPNVSLKGFLQIPHVHRGAPADWEFGNCLL